MFSRSALLAMVRTWHLEDFAQPRWASEVVVVVISIITLKIAIPHGLLKPGIGIGHKIRVTFIRTFVLIAIVVVVVALLSTIGVAFAWIVHGTFPLIFLVISGFVCGGVFVACFHYLTHSDL